MIKIKTQQELSNECMTTCNNAAYKSYLNKINSYICLFNDVDLTEEEENYINYLAKQQDGSEFNKLFEIFKKLKGSC